MICGRPGVISAYAFGPMQHLETAPLPDDWHLVVASSGVAAEKTGAALESYNRLARGVGVLLELWNRDAEPADSLASALRSGPEAEHRLLTLVRNSSIDGWPPEALEKRLVHFIREDSRIPDAMRAFRARDALSLTEIATASQRDSEELLQNQVDQTMKLTRLASAAGALGARSFGAGFGGSVWALVAGHAESAEAFAKRWLGEYRAAHPDRQSIAFVAKPGPGVVELVARGKSKD